MTDPSVRERKTKRADELKPGDVTAAGELLDNPAEVLYASTYGPNGSRPVTLLVFREVGSTRPLNDEINPAAEFELADAGEPSVWADISAELHKLADDVLLLVGEPAPACFDISIQPRNPDRYLHCLVKNRPAIIATVDAIAMALLDKPSEDHKMSDGTFHRDAKGRRGPISVSILTSIADPDAVDPEQEIARLRAEVAELKAAQYYEVRDVFVRAGGIVGSAMEDLAARGEYADAIEWLRMAMPDRTGMSWARSDAPEDGELTQPGRVEPHTGGVTDGGLVDETGPVHMAYVSGATVCGVPAGGEGRRSLVWREVTCKACTARPIPPTDPDDLPCQPERSSGLQYFEDGRSNAECSEEELEGR